ncbi:MAG TPA: hypothetical protein VN303_08490 [Pseudomonas sp.]|nr:hypothetical protein [Pseudomonas sp.]
MDKPSLDSIIASSATTQLQLRRLSQIIFVITIALSLVALQNVQAGNWRTSGLMFGTIVLL